MLKACRTPHPKTVKNDESFAIPCDRKCEVSIYSFIFDYQLPEIGRLQRVFKAARKCDGCIGLDLVVEKKYSNPPRIGAMNPMIGFSQLSG